MNFNNISFKGVFRDYQQRVLDNSSKFLFDGKINIVAAPGSGKTILGLELIRRLDAPCIIFSPTTTIRQQWGQRFLESFLNDNQNIDDFVSYDLDEIKLINSVTYQALHSTINKIKIDDEEEQFDYSNIDLFKLIIDKGIKTICLDEAHHLQNEWQKALEVFVKGLSKDIKIISLTATPPYDSTPAEWNRYISVCGEIDDEIFVPELVKEKTLCPHQDYILFNYPTKSEVDSFKQHRENCLLAINEIEKLEFIPKLNEILEKLYFQEEEYVYSNYKGIVALYILLNNANIKINSGVFKRLTNSIKIPNIDLKYCERAYQFLLDSDKILHDDEKSQLESILKKYSLISRKKVRLELTDKLKRTLISSCGKLNSISRIVNNEYESLNDKLRLLILTDYIKKEEITNIGKDIEIKNISIVSIFEQIRKNTAVKVGCLSGSLVILPLTIEKILLTNYMLDQKDFNVIELDGTSYGIYNFKGKNKEKVDIVSKLFEDGEINVLVGTQALLGEGWDSPCINSLILASYVGSFMLSNQMRGRAIRIDKNNHSKTANIWHLVTIEPEYVFEENILNKVNAFISQDKNVMISYDYDTLSRRFDCFVGPNYDTGDIESGIERITYVIPPYTYENIEKINEKMFVLARNREQLSKIWEDTTSVSAKTIIETQVDKELKIPAFTFLNMFMLLFVTSMTTTTMIFVSRIISNGLHNEISVFGCIALTIAGLGLASRMYRLIEFICKHISPSKSFISISKVILNSLKELGVVHDGAVLSVKEDQYKISTHIAIKNASIYEQNIFNEAIKELLSPIDNPKYLIIKKNIFGAYDYSYSFACPTVFAKNSNNVSIFKKQLKKSIGNLDIKYAYSEDGRKLLVKARKKAFITQNAKKLKKRQKVSKFD